MSKSWKALAAFALIPLIAAKNSSLPIVDLGYELHQAASFNVRCTGCVDSVCVRI